MQVDYLIIGQGVSGTFLSFYLLERGATVMVIDQPQSFTPSRVAAGIMNPVTGRRLSTVWKADEIFSFIPEAYAAIGNTLGIEAYSRKDIVDMFPNPFMRESFQQKLETEDQYVKLGANDNQWNDWFNMEFGYGEIFPVFTAHLDLLIPAWRNHLSEKGIFRDEKFEIEKLKRETDHVIYDDIIAKKIIFCEGPDGMENPFFTVLPFSKNKGQALVVRIPDVPNDRIYKKSMLLVPLPEKEMFWLGASYEWNFEHTNPTKEFREKSEASLREWLKCNWKVEDQRSGLRPATLERRPFVGMHPQHPSVGIFNGMGTKGCSLAPFFAKQFVGHLLDGKDIAPEADVQRFSKRLSKS